MYQHCEHRPHGRIIGMDSGEHSLEPDHNVADSKHRDLFNLHTITIALLVTYQSCSCTPSLHDYDSNSNYYKST